MIARLARAVAGGALLLSSVISPVTAANASPPPTKTPIQHAVFLMGDGRSFDSMFGSYPGADGIPPGTCLPNDPATPDDGCVAPQWVGDRTVRRFVHRAAEDRIKHLEATVRHHENRADRAEKWLYQISMEIEQKFFGGENNRPSQNQRR